MTASTVTAWEEAEIERANASGLTPVVFVHGLWLLSSSWQRWRELFEANGYTTVAPGWPDDPASVQEAFDHPEVFAHKKVQAVTDHYLDAIKRLTKKPAVVGHSFGGLIAQKIAGSGASVATVSIDNAPFRGILPLPISSLKSSFPVLGNPANYGKAIALTFEQYKYGWANNLEEAEARELYETYHVPAPGLPLFQAAVANFNPFSETRVGAKNPDRGPLLVIAGENDHTIPLAITEATFKLQSKQNPGVTEIERIPGRGHSLVIDGGWKEVADVTVKFIQRFA
ncbi:alpha/beta hydrolase [Mycobacterium sp. Aquia_216]|uniref:alpha/beta hydrolase n=1 Tax=Mycobacterium sp. Aquia_216 TaxID=2991729 RepID=UPI00227C89A3|nr:alpha/beta hydrolase [Mycobacterium sp. Aquia_216]WAJ43138.1 alpha/beta hydrolase [Mycobacterium sp. Aquia_216]